MPLLTDPNATLDLSSAMSAMVVTAPPRNRCSRSSTTSTLWPGESVRWSRRWQRSASMPGCAPAAPLLVFLRLQTSSPAFSVVATSAGDVLYLADRYSTSASSGTNPAAAPAQACGCAGHLARRCAGGGDTFNDLSMYEAGFRRCLRGGTQSLRCWRHDATRSAFHACHWLRRHSRSDRPFQLHRRGGTRRGQPLAQPDRQVRSW